MIPALIVLQILTLVALIVLVVRHSSAAPAAAPPVEDPRLAQLLAADLPAQFTRLDARSQGLDQHLRAELSQLRTDTASSSASLRTEVLTSMDTLGNTLHSKLETSRVGFAAQANESREALHSRLSELRTGQSEHLETLRKTVEDRLDKLNLTNAAKLEEMRVTVDEKLHATLQTRLTESFGQVTDQLTKVHAGLGEMTKLSAGVDDLSRIFTNVKSRGTIGACRRSHEEWRLRSGTHADRAIREGPIHRTDAYPVGRLGLRRAGRSQDGRNRSQTGYDRRRHRNADEFSPRDDA